MSRTRYLQKLGQRWYVQVKVPRALQGRVGNTHIRRALGTSDLEEANRRKWDAIQLIQRRFAALAAHCCSLSASPARGDLSATPAALDAVDAPATVSLPAQLADRSAPERQMLDALLAHWLEGADYLAQTKQQHAQAYRELRKFLGGNRPPEVVTAQVALEFVEERIKTSDWAFATKRRKLNSLVSFWTWLGERRSVQRGFNPWMGFRLGKKHAEKQKTRPKRPYSMEELDRLLGGRPSYPGLADVVALGLLTGARLEEICALRMKDLRNDGPDGFLVSIVRAKTQAGIRTISVSHAVGRSILERRWKSSALGTAQLFPEFSGGGYDDRLSWAVSKAFGRFRDRMRLPREVDFHSFRRTFITLLENLSVDQVRIARYVGHELPTLAFTVYSGGSTEKTMRETGRAVRYPESVERQLSAFVTAALTD